VTPTRSGFSICPCKEIDITVKKNKKKGYQQNLQLFSLLILRSILYWLVLLPMFSMNFWDGKQRYNEIGRAETSENRTVILTQEDQYYLKQWTMKNNRLNDR